jgi:hypothetical protein
MANKSSPLATAFFYAVLAGSTFGLTVAAENKWLDDHQDAVSDAVIAAGAAGITAWYVRQRSLE